MQELWFLCSARGLMLIDIDMKFCEDGLNGFQVIERTRMWQIDRRPWEKQYVANPKVGRHTNVTTKNAHTLKHKEWQLWRKISIV